MAACGGHTKYTKGCDDCREAQRIYGRQYRAGVRIGRKPRTPGPEQHGTRYQYRKGCRCEWCALANREYQREYMRLWREGVSLPREPADTREEVLRAE